MIKGRVVLLDGSLEFIENSADLVEIVRVQLGFDAADKVRELVELAEYTERKLDTDLTSYESQVESMHSSLSEIADWARKLRKELAAPRLYRSNLEKVIGHIESEISNHL